MKLEEERYGYENPKDKLGFSWITVAQRVS